MTTFESIKLPGPSRERNWRFISAYPSPQARRAHLALVVAITITLYYAQYVGGGVATLILPDLQMPFIVFVAILAVGNLLGAFASLLAGLCDRFGRANLIVYGLLLVTLLTLVALPMARNLVVFGLATMAVAFVEGIILVATPALIRDFSPQVGRATAMGFWTVGPVLGSLMVSAVTTLTLPHFGTWQSQYVICGCLCFCVFTVAAIFLRELAPALRDQIMVSERDRELNELNASQNPEGTQIDFRRSFASLLRLEVIASAFGVSLLLLFYYTAVAFGTIYLVTVLHFTVAAANAVGNWFWASNAVALIIAGLLSDRLRVRKPFMLGGGVCALLFTIGYLSEAGRNPSWWIVVGLSCGQSVSVAFAYSTWMASFTETVEARNPAGTAMGLAIWGWMLRLVVAAFFVALPFVINTVTPLVSAGHVIAEYQKVQASHGQPGPALVQALTEIKLASAQTAAQWRTWYWICVAGIAVFLASIFVMRGRWSPARASADEIAHDEEVSRQLARTKSVEAVEVGTS